MIYQFLNKLEPELRDYIYDINEQDGLEFSFQVPTDDTNSVLPRIKKSNKVTN